MEFARPHWLWLLFAVPAVAFWLALGVRRSRADLERFAGRRLADSLAPGYSWRKNLLKGFLKTSALALVIVALAGPRFGTQLVKVDREGIDVVVALDTSLSMLAEDMLPNRLERAKQAIIDLIKGLEGDRVGIVVFAGDAYALCPLTVDYDAALMFTRTVDVDMVSEPGTALGKAISTGAALFEESTKRDRALIVVTDGEGHEGDPRAEAQKAAEKGIRIFTIGIGNPAGELIPERAADGSIAGYKKDRRGETVLTRLDEKTLQDVASASSGKYLPATREGLELRVLYNEIAGMERKAIKGEFVERRKERFWVFLAAALGFLLLDTVVGARGRISTPKRLLHTGISVFVTALTVMWAGQANAAWKPERSVDRDKVKSGNKYFHGGEYDKALTLYREALGDTVRLPKHHQGVFYNQGNTLFMQQKYDEAVEMYQRSYSPDSTLTGEMLYNRANALFESGKLPEAIESYVQSLQYLPDDEDARHNLEVALKLMQEQQQQQQQQRNSDDQQQQKEQEEQQQNQQQQQQQEGEQQEQEQQQQQEGEQQQPQPDSTETPEPQPDSTVTPPPAELTPEEMMQLSKEDAMRILRALEEQEKKLQRERRRAAFRRLKKSGKDW